MSQHNTTINPTVVDPFPQYVWRFKYNFDTDNLVNKFYKHKELFYKSSTPLEIGNSYSSVASEEKPHEWSELDDFNTWLAGPTSFLAEYWKFRPSQYTSIFNSWFNIHGNGGETLEHCHAYANFVVSAYIKKPKESGDIVFRDPLEYHKINWPIDGEEHLFKKVECNQNDILIFPGWLKHKTEVNNSTEDRIVLTYNIGIENLV